LKKNTDSETWQCCAFVNGEAIALLSVGTVGERRAREAIGRMGPARPSRLQFHADVSIS
jgi:hypothetical protein